MLFTWNAIFSSSKLPVIGNLTKSQMMLYIILGHVSIFVFGTSMVLKMGTLIRSGKLTTHLLRPYSLIYFFCRILS
ncbi:TPA: ABC-2 family transporter protein [Streptococcus suis]|nr:ABC-2 family transporter protein [Streptococcus suis]HEM2749799.1 ABC-2 family transporter protein [Streptococcus suis]